MTECRDSVDAADELLHRALERSSHELAGGIQLPEVQRPRPTQETAGEYSTSREQGPSRQHHPEQQSEPLRPREQQTTVPFKGEARPPSGESESVEGDSLAAEKATETVQTPVQTTQPRAESNESAAERLAGTYEAIKAAEELKHVSSELLAQGFRESDDVKVTPGHTETLDSARQEVLRALEAEQGNRIEAEWTSQLVPAAKQILEGMEKYLVDDGLWGRLKGVEAATTVLDDPQRLVMMEVLDQRLGTMLTKMGYREPPPALQLEAELKASLVEMLQVPRNHAMRAVTTRRAEQNMAIFAHRLRRVITEAEREGMDRSGGRDRERASVQARLREAMNKGAEVAAPAAVAAGAAGLVFSSPGEAGVGAGALAAGRELLRQGVQLAATGLLSKVVAGEASIADAGERFNGATRRIQNALSDYVAGLESLAQEPTPLKVHLAENLGIESLSSVYGLLQAELDYAGSRHYALHVSTQAIVAQLRDGQRLIETSNNLDELTQLAQTLELQRRRLGDLIAAI